MIKKYFITALIFAGLLFGSQAFSQSFSSKTNKQSISGDKITKKRVQPNKNTARYLDNNQKKKKIKTGNKSIRHQSCSNFNMFFSVKKNQRQKALARKRRKLS